MLDVILLLCFVYLMYFIVNMIVKLSSVETKESGARSFDDWYDLYFETMVDRYTVMHGRRPEYDKHFSDYMDSEYAKYKGE